MIGGEKKQIMRNLIIDCDTGHDDALAILVALAHSEAINLLAVTTVCGNSTLENVTDNTRQVLDLAASKTILAMGATRPLVGGAIISDEFHGKSGMDGPTALSPPCYPVSSKHAVNVMRDLLLKHDKVTIAALAPLTNIALLLRMYPEVVSHIDMISVMGGGFVHGNTTPHAEFNIYVDAEAAEIMFSSGIPIVMSSLDITEQVLLYPEDWRNFEQKGPVGKFFAELMAFYFKSASKFGLSGCAMHDPCAVAYLLMPEMFEGEHADVSVVLSGERRGATVRHKNAAGDTLILTKVTPEAIAHLIVSSVERLIK